MLFIAGKWVLGIGLLGPSVLALVTPAAAMGGFELVLAVRVAQGIFEASR